MATNKVGIKPAGDPQQASATPTDWAEVQTQLGKAGFDPQGVDGVFGPNTRAALVAFQKANHLSPANGTLTDKTRELLAMVASERTEEAESGPIPHGWLTRGATGPIVEDLQRELKEAGADPVQIDGIFGPNTRRAVLKFQEDQGLPTTGSANQATWKALGGDRFRAAPTVAPKGPPLQPPPLAPRPVTPAPAEPEPSAEPAPAVPSSGGPVAKPSPPAAPAPVEVTPVGAPGAIPPEKSIAMLGDSITANGGYGKDLQSHLPGWRIDNFGIVGNRTDQMSKRLGIPGGDTANHEVDLSQYKTLIVLGGVNDIASGRSLGQIEQSLRQIYDKADQQGVRVVAMTVSPWKGYPSWTPARQATTDKLNAFIRAEAQRRGYPVVDLASALSAKNDKPPGDPAALSAKYRGPGTEGLLHPGAAGQREIGELIDHAAFEAKPAPATPAEPATPPAPAPGEVQGSGAPVPAQPAVPATPAEPAALPDPAKSPVAFFRALADANQAIKLNESGPNVKALQTALNVLGIVDPPIGADGVYGKNTAAAVKTFAAQFAPGSDGTSLSPDAARALATQLERPGVIAAGFRLFNAFNSVKLNTKGLRTPPIQEAANQLRAIAAEPDDAKKLEAMHAFVDLIAQRASEADATQLNAADPTWQADIAALRNHFDAAAQNPGGLATEVKVAQTQLQEANNQRLDAGMKLVSQELLKQSAATQQQFLGLIDALAAPDPKAPASPAFQAARKNLSEFLLAHGGENKKAMSSAVRQAWDELEATLIEAQDASQASGNTQNAVKPFIDFLEQKYLADTQALIKVDPKNPGIANIPQALKDRIAQLEKAADSNANPLVTDQMLQKLVTDAGYPALSPAKAQAMAAGLNTAMNLAHITTAHERAAFLAQCVVETGGLRTFQEEDGGNPHYFDRYDNNRGIGNLGHPDGTTFHGRGPVQLTGRDNYTRFSRWMNDGDQVMKNPDLVATDPKYSFTSAGWFWMVNHLNDPANQGNLRLVVQRLNGPGMLGWDKRLSVYNDALVQYAKENVN